jgi:hypothetical protein
MDVAGQIAGALEAATEPKSRNAIGVGEVRVWLSDLVDDYADEFGGPTARRDHFLWDFIVADEDAEREALYVAAVFLGGEVELAVGRGSAPDVRKFAESDFPNDPRLLIEEVATRFPVASIRLSLPRADVGEWIGHPRV